MLRRNLPPSETAPPAAADSLAQVVTRRRVEVTVEREWARETISSPNPQPVQQPVSFEAHCASCGARVLMIAPVAAARMAGVTIRTIYRWVDEQKLHFLESPAGDLYLCAQSIPAPYPPQAFPNKTLPPGDSR